MLTVACVYKTGGRYTSKDVNLLYTAVSNNLKEKFEFVCLTDYAKGINPNVKTIPLIHNLRGWWSKMEMYRPGLFEGRVLYFDLDTIILDSISELVKVAKKHPFMMLRGFNVPMLRIGDVPASGIFSFDAESEILQSVYKEFMQDPVDNIRNQQVRAPRALVAEIQLYEERNFPWQSKARLRLGINYRKEIPYRRGGGQMGDQGFVGEFLGWDNIPKFQRYLPPSYIIHKVEALCHPRRNPPVNIVCWSGTPTIAEAATKIPWINKYINQSTTIEDTKEKSS